MTTRKGLRSEKCGPPSVHSIPELRGPVLKPRAIWLTNAWRTPHWASETGRSPALKNRIQTMLLPGVTKPLTRRAQSLYLLTSLFLLSFSLRGVAGETPKVTANSEKPPASIEIVVTDEQGRPIESGTAQLRGTTEFANFFYRLVPIKQGKAIVALKTNRLEEMVLTLESRGHMSFEKEYISAPHEPCVVFAPRQAFQLASGIRIGGKVVDAQGKPIAQAKVLVTSTRGRPTEQGKSFCWQTEVTDAAGHWELSGAPPDLAGLAFEIERIAYKALDVPIVSPVDQANLKSLKDVRTLEIAPVYSGFVEDPEGKPVSGATVLVCDRISHYWSNREPIPRTDAAGLFHLLGVLPGNHVLGIFSPNWDIKMVSVSLPPAGTATPWKFTLKKGKRVEFRTRNPKGEPISGIKFFAGLTRGKLPTGDVNFNYVLQYLMDQNFIPAKSDQHGVFVWQNAPDEPLEYQFTSPKVLSLPPGDFGPVGSPHTLVFRDSIPITAKVVDAETGRPILSYKVYRGIHIKRNRPETWNWHVHGSSKVQPGRFVDSLMSLSRLVQYRIEAHGYRPALSDVFDAEKLPDAPISIEFRLEKEGDYAGRIVRPDGKPAEEAKVYAQSRRRGAQKWLAVVNGAVDESKMAAVAVADVEGLVRLPPLDGPYVCFISHDSGYAQMLDTDLSHKSEIRLTPWAKVEGELRIHGKPAAHISIGIHQRDFGDLHSEMPAVAQSKLLRTDAEGKYRFEHCVAGEWRESIVYDETGGPLHVAYQQTLTVELVPGQTMQQRIGAEGTNFKGRVLLPKGADLSRSSIHLVPRTEMLATAAGKSRPNQTARFEFTRQMIHLKQDGSFQFFNVEPAEQKLIVSIPLLGEGPSRPDDSKEITITRAMFVGKTPQNSIDLGEITLKPRAR
jgi:hypothetical protein